MNSFFNSLEYVALLENSISAGNKSATYFKLNSKTRFILGERQGILKAPIITKSNIITDNIVKVLNDNKMLSIKEALFICKSTYYEFKTSFKKEEKERIYEARNNNKLINKNK